MAAIGLAVAVWAIGWGLLEGFVVVIRTLDRRRPDPTMTTAGVYFRSRGVSTFDRRKYIECRLVLARREMASANQRYRELRAALGDETVKGNVLPMRKVQ